MTKMDLDATLAEIGQVAATPQISIRNDGFDDKYDIVCIAIYADGTSSTFFVEAKLLKGARVSKPLKAGTSVTSFTILCRYDGHLRTCGQANAAAGTSFTRCNLWWAETGQYEEALAFGS